MVNDGFIPLDQFLVARLQETNGSYRSESPRLGIVGDYRIGQADSVPLVGRKLTDKEFQEYADATLSLGRQSAVQHLIEITRLNHSEFGGAIQRLADAYEQDHNVNWKRATEMIMNVNRHILNFLSSMKTFLDHTQTRLDRQFGKESMEFNRYKTAEHAAFDNHFSYRFVCKLRDYTQHCGMPLGHINANVNQDDPPNGPVRHTIDFFFDRDSLLSKFSKWSRHVEPDLQTMPSLFPIAPHVDMAMKCVEEINAVVMDDTEAAMRQGLEVVDAFVNEIRGVEGTPCVFTLLSADAKSTTGKTLSNISFQRFQMQHVEGARRILAEIALRREAERVSETR